MRQPISGATAQRKATGWESAACGKAAWLNVEDVGGMLRCSPRTVRRVASEKYARIVGYQLGPKPAGGCDREGCVLTEEVPF